MAKSFFLLLSTFFFSFSIAQAENISVGGIVYLLSDKSLTAEVGPSENGYQDAVSIPSTVTYNGSTYTVTAIGEKAFAKCSSLSSISIPSSISRIGKDAFEGCDGLAAVHITDISAWCALEFSDNESNPLVCAHQLYLNGILVEHLVVPAQASAVGQRAFTGCSSLKSVTFSQGIVSIGDYAFSNCSNLSVLSFPASLQSIGAGGFSFCGNISSIQVPANLRSVGSGAFYGCSGLTAVHIADLAAWCNLQFVDSKSNPLVNAGRLYLNGTEVTDLTIPAGITKVGDYVFSDCVGITSLVLPEGVTSVGDGAFSGCVGLTSLTFPKSLTSVGKEAFMFCNGLTEVTFPHSVLSVGKDAFSGCIELKAVHTKDLRSWCQTDFANYNANPLFYAQHLYDNGQEITALRVPEGTTSIGNHAFVGYALLETVEFASSVTSIGNGAFSGCAALSPTIVLSQQLVHIGEKTFADCTGLYYMTLPASLVTIDRDAFIGCRNMKTVCCLAEIVPETHVDAFDHSFVGQMSLHVPDGCVNYYLREAPWNKFAQVVPYEAQSNPIIQSPASIDVQLQADQVCIQGLSAGQQVRLYSLQGRLLAAAVAESSSLCIPVAALSPQVIVLDVAGLFRKTFILR